MVKTVLNATMNLNDAILCEEMPEMVLKIPINVYKVLLKELYGRTLWVDLDVSKLKIFLAHLLVCLSV